MADESLDIVIVGAGLSGINAAHRLQSTLPDRRFAILEGRDRIGGTWDFWKYPGARTDSAMVLFGYPWYPWRARSNMASAHAIRDYLEEAAAAEGIDKKIRFRHRIVEARWSSAEQKWTLQVDVTAADGTVRRAVLKTWWLLGAGGYYSYDKPQEVVIPGIERFGGEVVHPQFWDEKTVYAGKEIVVIGSGATAVTLLPALAKTAKHVTMLQRSPSYVFSVPGKVASPFWEKFLPQSWSESLNWWAKMFLDSFFVWFLYAFPNFGRKIVRGAMRKELPKDFDFDKHFSPRYNPFEQRLCFCPDGDFFKALHRPNVEIVTDTIETVTEAGISLHSGQNIQADMIITATGLYLVLLSGMAMFVDGVQINDSLGQRYAWHGTMLEGVPNSGIITGYTAGTWTPGADLRVRQLIKVIKQMEEKGATSAMPYLDDAERAKFPKAPLMALSSTYVVNAADRLPMNADTGPWRAGKTWLTDGWHLLFGSVTAGMRYTIGRSKDD
ncbi:hypothetical protein B0H67DRAFT_572630 [Lasiosphaeris hirsuta]|uniref:FAD-containing monooxygenase EthA n=1 Tax=Lasiosphaeris hirsuta TaxID=260670 RepID=A0AA40ANN5_9PEZI|nr:hypothetical protein B0H67DRAFT_572630 [Lasiosphaeris hirsuta]